MLEFARKLIHLEVFISLFIIEVKDSIWEIRFGSRECKSSHSLCAWSNKCASSYQELELVESNGIQIIHKMDIVTGLKN
jgi:hypothetical protein